VNSIFGRVLAPVGTGRSVTRTTTRHRIPGYPVTVYDTPGVAVGQSIDSYVGDMVGTIRANYADPNDRIHFALYCVLGTGERFEEPEEAVVAALAKEVPVALVLTQCPSPSDKRVRGLADEIASRGLDVVAGRPLLTLTQDMEIGGIDFPAFGLPELVAELRPRLDDAERYTFVRHQVVSLELKVADCKKIINGAAGLAAGIAAVPIPLYDAIPISITQLTMLGEIAAQMDLPVNTRAVVTALGAVFGVATTARFAASFFKVIPGVGSVVNAGIASAATKGLGEAFLAACTQVAQRRIAGEPIADSAVTEAIIAELRAQFRLAGRT